MDQVGIIRDLLSWLDSHLDMPLTLDHVAAKSGYTKWHLQRMFKEVTGQAIGSYIRRRRLSKAAIALRLTSKSILEIALQYHFDSQQTFTRAFKKQFNQTPAHYRRTDDWNTRGLCSPILLDGQVCPNVEYVTLPETKLIGVCHEYSCALDRMSDTLLQYRLQFWQSYLSNVALFPHSLYGLHHVKPGSKADDEQDVYYTTAVEASACPEDIAGEPVIIPEGRYAKFHYQGTMQGLQNFILSVYTSCIPQLNLTRLKGHDIEIFSPGNKRATQVPPIIKCDYLIPIKPSSVE
jgi:AraC family transcriptional activator of mar-sox-rob regulon